MRMDPMYLVLAYFSLICFYCVSADFTALTEGTPVIEAQGNTAALRCHTSTPERLNEVRWIRIQDGKYSIINLFRGGRDQQRCDLPEYIGRTELVKEGLARGCADLKLLNVSVPDGGMYRCYLETVDYFDMADLELQVTALGSDPKIEIERFNDDGIMAVCRSAGWYPEPTLVNKDDDGELKIQEEYGFYSVEYSRIIMENSDRTFSCRLRTPFPNQERESSVYLAGDLFRKSTTTDATIIISTVIPVLLMCLTVVVALFTLRTCLSHKQEPSNSPNTKGPDQNLPLFKSQRVCALT